MTIPIEPQPGWRWPDIDEPMPLVTIDTPPITPEQREALRVLIEKWKGGAVMFPHGVIPDEPA